MWGVVLRTRLVEAKRLLEAVAFIPYISWRPYLFYDRARPQAHRISDAAFFLSINNHSINCLKQNNRRGLTYHPVGIRTAVLLREESVAARLLFCLTFSRNLCACSW